MAVSSPISSSILGNATDVAIEEAVRDLYNSGTLSIEGKVPGGNNAGGFEGISERCNGGRDTNEQHR